MDDQILIRKNVNGRAYYFTVIDGVHVPLVMAPITGHAPMMPQPIKPLGFVQSMLALCGF